MGARVSAGNNKSSRCTWNQERAKNFESHWIINVLQSTTFYGIQITLFFLLLHPFAFASHWSANECGARDKQSRRARQFTRKRRANRETHIYWTYKNIIPAIQNLFMSLCHFKHIYRTSLRFGDEIAHLCNNTVRAHSARSWMACHLFVIETIAHTLWAASEDDIAYCYQQFMCMWMQLRDVTHYYVRPICSMSYTSKSQARDSFSTNDYAIHAIIFRMHTTQLLLDDDLAQCIVRFPLCWSKLHAIVIGVLSMWGGIIYRKTHNFCGFNFRGKMCFRWTISSTGIKRI